MQLLTASNGTKIPALGFGVFQIGQNDCKRCVLDAISEGYRHIDTAQVYLNEKGVGDAIKECGVAREKLFITTKIWIDEFGYEKTKKAFYKSLETMGLDYLDMVLLHQPFNDYYGAYRALEELYAEGLIRVIGVSNFLPDRFVDLCSYAEVKPMVNQIKCNPVFQQTEAKMWMDKYGVITEAYSPIAQGDQALFSNAVINSLAEKYGKSVAQISLRWNLQRGVMVIPKSTHKERMAENIAVFDFEISEEDMQVIAALDAQPKTVYAQFDHRDPARVEWFVNYSKNR